jgi:hypothetical protein
LVVAGEGFVFDPIFGCIGAVGSEVAQLCV